MPLITLKEKGQITLPAQIRKLLDAHKGDLFDCEYIGGKVVLTPQKIVPAIDGGPTGKGVDISRYIGATSGTYGSAVEADEYIRKERDSWE